MGSNFDRWAVLKLFEFALCVTCLIFKRLTDDEANRLFLYLQKLSREWSLLNNVTWDRIGASVADATYGGYVIITAGLFIGKIAGELPTHKRISERVFLGVGAILFIILGSLEFASLDSVPADLIDNAAILGTLSLVTAGLFLLDMGGPRAKKYPKYGQQEKAGKAQDLKASPRTISQQVYEVEREKEKNKDVEKRTKAKKEVNGVNEGVVHSNGVVKDEFRQQRTQPYKQMQEKDNTKRFGIYGKDVMDFGAENSETDTDDELPPKMEQHSPVWSNIRKGYYGKYDIIHPSYIYPNPKLKDTPEIERPPSGPGDPGYVQYTAQHWGENKQKTPRQSPTQV